MPHDHNHSQDHCDSCSHGDDADEANALAFSLYQKIDTLNVECLNEAIDGSGITVFKPWHERFDTERFVESDTDAELLYNIPFTGDVKLTGIALVGCEHLNKIRLFKSNMRMSFDNVNVEADQEFVIEHREQGILEFPVKPTKFFNVHHLTIHFVNKHRTDDSEPCRIFYIGFKGTFTHAQRDAIVITSYELRPTEGISQNLKSNVQQVQ